MKNSLFAFLMLVPTFGWTSVIYEQPSLNNGVVIVSSWVEPEGSDSDMYVYESFMLGADQAITEVQWRGAYQYGAPYGKAWNFTITIYESTAGNTEPHVNNPQLEEFYLAFYEVGNNAGEASVGVFGGKEFFDYDYVLPAAFLAEAGKKYWIRIEASQSSYPDWGLAAGSGSNGSHFRFSTGAAMFTFGSGDTAFRLLTVDGAPCTISASPDVAEGGSITGAGVYPAGAKVGLRATPNPGFLFKRWKQGATTVSNSSYYIFTASGNRALTAIFEPAIAISTEALPLEGGTTAGGGDFSDGDEVIVTAAANPGYTFLYWSESDVPVHLQSSYSFSATVSRALIANFAPSVDAATFDLDTATPTLSTGQGIPLDQTVDGLTARFDSPQGSAFSIQTDSSTQWNMSQFSGHYLYPNNLNRNHLTVDFSAPLSAITLSFATGDNHQTEVPTNMLLTAYYIQGGGTTVGTSSTHATYGSDTFPMGLISFAAPAGQVFDKIDLYLPYQPLGATSFFTDNFIVTKATEIPTPTPTPTPFDDSLSLGAQLPPVMAPGSHLLGSVTMRNTGNTTWTLASGYALLVLEDSCSILPLGVLDFGAEDAVSPWSKYGFFPNIQAPLTEGICTFQFQMMHDGIPFGEIASGGVSIEIPSNSVSEWVNYE